MMRALIATALWFAACVGTSDSVLEQPPPSDTANTLTDDVIGIAAGDSHACALNRDGTIACWGMMDIEVDDHGEGTVKIIPPPYGSFTAIGAGASYSCALRIDGTIACWG